MTFGAILAALIAAIGPCLPELIVGIIKMFVETYAGQARAYNRGAADAHAATLHQITEIADAQAHAAADSTDDPDALARRLRARSAALCHRQPG